jgi:hypothetical protein
MCLLIIVFNAMLRFFYILTVFKLAKVLRQAQYKLFTQQI